MTEVVAKFMYLRFLIARGLDFMSVVLVGIELESLSVVQEFLSRGEF